ncbi:MAG TPA: HNH endonuclease signature motif containing protein [Blastocatellia bacterium]|nr:HNH endonuclease signature motif containing protein [Blastocatellia bacterium]
MSLTRIPAALRRQVRERARGRCEYCLLAEEHAFFSHEADHIIAEKHGGRTTAQNLALACFDCNRFKGSDIASVDGTIVPLFNPRSQTWGEYFVIADGRIIPLTSVGRVTEQLLKFCLPERVEVREILAKSGPYP